MVITAFVLSIFICLKQISALTCLSCAGIADSDCHIHPEKLISFVNCGSEEKYCANYVQIFPVSRDVRHITRGCPINVIPMAKEDWNKCKTESTAFVDCVNTCNTGDNCNQNITIVPPGWTAKAYPIDDPITKRKNIKRPTIKRGSRRSNSEVLRHNTLVLMCSLGMLTLATYF